MRKMPVKYVFVFGGVLSGLGKGIVASSLGFLLKSRGLKITIQHMLNMGLFYLKCFY